MQEFLLKIKELLNHEIILGVVFFLGAIFCAFIFRFVLIRLFYFFLKKIKKKEENSLFQAYFKSFLKPIGNLAFLLSLKFLNAFLKLGSFQGFFNKTLEILFIVNISWFFYALVHMMSLYFQKKASQTESKLDDQLVPILRKFLKALVLILAALFVFQNLGYSISGILAGMGIGGFALAFASKDALSHIFGSIIIFTDKPFQVGDWIVTSGIEGIVEEVGLRSTKIRTFEKTLVSVPNNTISNAVVENVSARRQRKVSFYLGIKHTTPSHLVKKALEELERLLKKHPKIDASSCVVRFREFGSSSFNIFFSFFTLATALAQYLQIQEEVNLAILETLEKLGVQIAVPATTVAIDEKV